MHRFASAVVRPFLALAALFLASTALAGILVCARCGYEYTEGQRVCSHCGGDHPPPEAPPARPAETPTKAPALDAAFVVESVRRAAEARQAGQNIAALLQARQAFAVAPLASALPPGLSEELREVAARAADAVRTQQIDCWACSGRTERIAPRMTMKGELLTQALPGQTCPVCSGRGSLLRHPTAERRDDAAIRATAAWRSAQAQRGLVERDGLWLPPGVDSNLSARARAAALGRVRQPCSGCLGLGFEGCSSCEGVGRTPCPERDCVMGRGRCAECKGSGRVRAQENGRTLTRSCPRCVQRGIADCSRCEGRGYLVCDTCGGRGELRCERCRGTAQNAECGRCRQGLVDCRTCKGTGKQGDKPCAVCHGETVTLCASCGGSGHRVKR